MKYNLSYKKLDPKLVNLWIGNVSHKYKYKYRIIKYN